MSAGSPSRRLSRPSRFAVRFIETYRANVSARVGATCRFEPTCSEYGLISYQRYGFVRATARTTWRLMRCNRRRRGVPIVDLP
jgi:putative membrane protein insertion efficiency factor